MSVSNPELYRNGVPIAIVPNSFKYNEGQPEKKVRAAVIGNNVTQDFTKNVESQFSEFSFAVYPTAENLDFIREIEVADNTNLFTASAVEVVSGVGRPWRRTFKNASIVNKVEKGLGSDATMTIDCMSDSAV